MGSNPAAQTDAERHPSFFVPSGAYPRKRNGPNGINDFNGFTVPPENHETNEINEITIPRCPTKITKSTKSTKSRFHGPQRNHESNDFNGFTIPHEKHESNGFNESNEMPEKEAFRCFRCIWANRDFVGNVAQARPKGAHTQYPKPPPPPLQICAKSRKSARGAFPSLQSGRGVLQCKALSLHHFITA